MRPADFAVMTMTLGLTRLFTRQSQSAPSCPEAPRFWEVSC